MDCLHGVRNTSCLTPATDPKLLQFNASRLEASLDPLCTAVASSKCSVLPFDESKPTLWQSPISYSAFYYKRATDTGKCLQLACSDLSRLVKPVFVSSHVHICWQSISVIVSFESDVEIALAVSRAQRRINVLSKSKFINSNETCLHHRQLRRLILLTTLIMAFPITKPTSQTRVLITRMTLV